jgi:ATP-dependent DNA helicase RecG
MEEKPGFYWSLMDSLLDQDPVDWIAFKENNARPDMIGEDLSALSNMARIAGLDHGYIVWGVRDNDHALVGTTFDPFACKKGNEDLIPWLRQMTSATIDFSFHAVTEEGKNFVVLEIGGANELPTRFAGKSYVRLASYTKDIVSQPRLERLLLEALAQAQEEDDVALSGLSEEELFTYLDFPAYYQAFNTIVPSSRQEMLTSFLREGFISRSAGGAYAISNLGALCFAKDLRRFPGLGFHIVRVGEREDGLSTSIRNPKDFYEGYVTSFSKILDYVISLTHPREAVNALGRTVVEPLYPPILIREALTNMMIHQAISASGESLMIWVSPKSLSFSNPGTLEVPVDRIIDVSPKAANEKLALFLRRLGIGDSQGTGFDKIEAALQSRHMPSALIAQVGGSVRLEIEAKDSYNDFNEEERLRSAYYCACLCRENRLPLTNDTLRLRFGLGEKDRPVISRLLSRAVSLGRLKIANADSGVRSRSYLPYWA